MQGSGKAKQQCMYAFTDWHNSWVQTLTMGTGSCM